MALLPSAPPPASDTQAGVVTTGDQTLGNAASTKTFPGNVTIGGTLTAPGFGGGGGVVTSVTAGNGLTLTAGDLAMGAASAAAAGAVTTGDQSLGGAGSTKTFASIIVGTLATLAETVTNLVRAVGAALVLRSDLGAGASDVAVKAGTSVADGSVNAAAKLLSVRTGLGGTEVEKAFFTTTGMHLNGGSVSGAARLSGNQVATGTGGFAMTASSFAMVFISGTGLTDAESTEAFRFSSGTTFANLEARIAAWRNSGGFSASPVALLRASGRIDQSGSDSSGTPGAATINKPIGTSAIAAGASSVVITNSLVAAGDWVMITPHARDATCKELIAVCGAGTITVSGSAAATAALAFSWEVKKRI